jgi:hypothetical protein
MRRGRTTPQFEIDPRFHTASVESSNPAKDQIPGMLTKPGKALMRSIQLRTLA